MSDDIIDEILNAKATFNSANIVDGAGRLVVKNIYPTKKTGKGGMKLFTIIEFVVESSKNMGPYYSPQRQANVDVEPNAPGSSCSAKFPLNNPDVMSGPGNAKAALLAIFGLTEDSIDPKSRSFDKAKYEEFKATLAQLNQDPSKAAGLVVDYETNRISTKGNAAKNIAPHDITLPNFKTAVGENTPEKVKARRATLV